MRVGPMPERVVERAHADALRAPPAVRREAEAVRLVAQPLQEVQHRVAARRDAPVPARQAERLLARQESRVGSQSLQARTHEARAERQRHGGQELLSGHLAFVR